MSARRKVETDGVRRCGWCSSGKHLPSDTSRGCIRYQGERAGVVPCGCSHESHAEEVTA